MTTRTYAYYTYTITNKASLILLGILAVTGGSLWVRYWAAIPPPIEGALEVAWFVWGLAFFIRLGEWIIRYLRTP